MKKRFLALFMTAIMGISCNVYAANTTKPAKATEKNAAKAAKTTSTYNYDWDHNDFTNQFTWKTSDGDKVYIDGDTMVQLNSSGRQTNVSKFSLASALHVL